MQLTINLSSFKEQSVRLFVYTQNATYWNKVIYDSPSLLYPFEWAFLCCSLAFKVRAVYLKAMVVWDYFCIIFFLLSPQGADEVSR